ncbi:hypothetical protein [Aggregatibacter segnis]|uniref:hypothetical protein n=1 Tax=Aggregatibacter segnis TaxID=739 RepID=UPI0014035A17|nr:hypothetical protein [Aggregatibacter segnis]
MMELQFDYDGITDGTTMAQASTLVPVTKMKKSTSVDACAIVDELIFFPEPLS